MMAEIFLLPISTFLPTSFIFMALSHISESLTFTKMIKHIMDEAQLTFFSHDAESPIPRPKYKCPFTFSHRVRIMRNLHPDVGKAGDSEMLPTKLTKWRRQCEQAMNYNGYGTHSQFGGLFKEALSCACLSRRTYKLLDNIMTKHNDLHISFKGNMIRGISGCYDELYIFSVLRQVDDGVIGLQEMNESLIKEKKNTRECRPSPDDPDAKQELAVLRAEVAKLRRELSQKAQKVASLEEELAKTKQTGHNGEARRDIFNFESPIPGNRTCRYSRPVFAPDSDSDDVSLGAGSSISDLENTNDLHANTFLQDNDIFTNNSLPDINMEPEMSSTPTSNSIIDEHHNESLTTTNCNMISNPELDDIFLTPEATILKPIPSETVIRGQAESNTNSRTRRSSKKKEKFNVGDSVNALFKNRAPGDNFEEFYPGKVLAILMSGDMLRIQFEDCTRTVPSDHVQPR